MHSSRHRSQLPLLAALAVVLTLVGGCNQQRVTLLDAQTVEQLAALEYPADAPYGPDLDVIVIGKRDTLLLTNRTARAYEQRELWLNRQYAGLSGTIPVGKSISYPLTRFVNEHREPYPVPGFLRPGDSFPVVLAELYDPMTGRRNRLTVQTIEGRTVGIEGQE